MADNCEGCRTTKEDVYWTHFHTMHFCQFLTRDFHSRLMIPKKFADNKRGELQEKVEIRGPSAASWEVALETSDDDILYFGDGWEEFVNDHTLQQNDILFFNYTGNSRFDVLMLDRRSLCEKEDSYFVTKCGHEKTEDGCHAKSSVETGEDGDDKEELESTRKKKPRKEAVVEETENLAHDGDGIRVKEAVLGLERVKRRLGDGANGSVTCASNQRTITQSEKMAAFQKACEELTDESFVVIMRPTHISKKWYMNVPAEWLTRHQIQQNQEVILRTGESSWQAKLLFDSKGHGGLSKGWRDFAMGNSLEEYDVCLFKLPNPKSDPVTLEVTIFRVVPEVVPPLRAVPVSTSTLRRTSRITSRSFS